MLNLKFSIMKKVLFAAFAGICIISSIMATPATKGKVKINRLSQNVNDTVPKPDTSKLVQYMDLNVKDSVPKPDSPKQIQLVDLSVR